jgi:putative flippase GtrA
MSLASCHVARSTVRRLIRYGSVSAISTLTSLSILGVLVGLVGFSAIWSNVIATAIGTVPSFELNRRWVWSHGGPRSLSRQALPYAMLAFAGLVLSTVAVHLAADATMSWTRFMHTAAVEIANLGAYGTLWVIQFLLCDRILFKPDANAGDDSRSAEQSARIYAGTPAAARDASMRRSPSKPRVEAQRARRLVIDRVACTLNRPSSDRHRSTNPGLGKT